MASSTPCQACLRLADDLEQHWSADESLNHSHRDIISRLRSIENDTNDSLSKIWTLVPILSDHLWEILRAGQMEEFKTAILTTLADTTREVPFWRPLFGLVNKPNYETNLKQRKRETPPDSVLEVARRIIAGTIEVSSDLQLRSALRIVANCCADNNINRSIIINRDGIEDLLEELLRHGRECDLVVPVLYNVCIDYDEPALDRYRRPWAPLPQTQALGVKDSAELRLSAAEQRLGTYWFLYEDKTSFEILLDAKDQAQSCAGTVADLIEMGSRVALFGAEHFVQENDGRDPDEVGEVDTTPAIIRLLLTKGIQLAQVDIDCRLSMCQALLNLLSQSDIRTTVINTESALWSLIHLPYPEDDESFTHEEKESLLIYQKAFLKIVYEISTADNFSPKTTDQSSLIQNCLSSLDSYSHGPALETPADGLLASIYVLIANSIKTKDQAQSLLRASRIAPLLCLQFPRLSDPEVLLPAIGLATRLALCPEGQDALQDMLHDVARVLHPTASEVDTIKTEIRRNACILMRLLIKGRTGSLQSLVGQPIKPSSPVGPRDQPSYDFTMSEALSLFNRTQDTQTKLEIGRLSIEFLRLLATLKTDSAWPRSIGRASDEHAVAPPKQREHVLRRIFWHQWPLPSVSAADTISYILTRPQSRDPSSPQEPDIQLEGEAWFGLGLLSVYTTTHASIRAALARDNCRLLTRLRDIVAEGSSSPVTTPATALSARPDPPEAVTSIAQHVGQTQPRDKQRDPRVENIKVLIVRLMQHQSTISQNLESLTVNDSTSPDPTTTDAEADKTVQSGLEAAAAEMGLDWVLV